MHTGRLAAAITLSAEIGYVLLATADGEGAPHIALAERLSLASGSRVVVEAWFCPETLSNLAERRDVALVVWQPEEGRGYQLIGKVVEILALNVLDGYVPGQQQDAPVAQSERRLLIEVEQVLDFSRAPRCDVPDLAPPA